MISEKNGYRCSWISRRHRDWQAALPQVNTDLILTDQELIDGEDVYCEYSASGPRAFIDYKFMLGTVSYAGLDCLQHLYTPTHNGYRQIPLFVISYDKRGAFRSRSMNQAAEAIQFEDRTMTEAEYIQFFVPVERKAL